MSFLPDNTLSISTANTRPYSIILGVLPTLATLAVLAIVAGLAAGLPLPARVTPDPALSSPVQTGASKPEFVLVLIDSAAEDWLRSDLEATWAGMGFTRQPLLAVVDAKADSALAAEVARELARLEYPFEVIDMRSR
jgi:hypothetical protein